MVEADTCLYRSKKDGRKTVPALCVTVRKLSDIFIHSARFECNVFYHFMIRGKGVFPRLNHDPRHTFLIKLLINHQELIKIGVRRIKVLLTCRTNSNRLYGLIRREPIVKTLNRRDFPGAQYPERIIQFGEGNFLRAFVDWQIDLLNEHTDLNSGGSLFVRLKLPFPPSLSTQDGLYTTIIRGLNEEGEAGQRRASDSLG